MVTQDTLVQASLALAALAASPLALLHVLLDKKLPSRRARQLLIASFLPSILLTERR